jgi:hypothetical protein
VIDGADRELFERSLQQATSAHTGAALDAALVDLGWHDALAADTHAAVSLLFTHQGAANATSSALDDVLGHALGHHGHAVVLPPGIATAAVARRATALVVESGVAFEVAASSLAPTAIEGMDPSLGLVDVRADLAGARELGPVDWRAAAALGQLALGHELVGASRRMLELARQHALDRVQFGRPIAAFQAVRHKLAETLVAIEAADAVLESAWLDHDPQTAGMAKAVAGRSARIAARHCQQVLAGIGFTTEHDLHRYVRRVVVLEHLLGSTRTLTRELGADIVDRRELPALLPL